MLEYENFSEKEWDQAINNADAKFLREKVFI